MLVWLLLHELSGECQPLRRVNTVAWLEGTRDLYVSMCIRKDGPDGA